MMPFPWVRVNSPLRNVPLHALLIDVLAPSAIPFLHLKPAAIVMDFFRDRNVSVGRGETVCVGSQTVVADCDGFLRPSLDHGAQDFVGLFRQDAKFGKTLAEAHSWILLNKGKKYF
jgi:hypothetical protein